MTSKEILSKYIEFFKSKGHKLIPNVSLVPENDPSLLFVNSGMFPLVPYLSGQPHPEGKRLVNVQRAVRFLDMEEVGDNRHTTAFHMIGNWSLGDYFKEDQLNWAYEFLINELGLDPKRLYSTVFAGDADAPKDEVSIEILKKVFAKHSMDAKEGERIFAYGKKSNWWQRGDAVGELGGPDSEVYFYMKPDGAPEGQGPEDDEDNFLEIGNSVFMQYIKTEKGWEALPQANVDFGGGLERIAAAVQDKKDIFETDNFWPIVEKVQEITGKNYYENPQIQKNMRILSDHMRASVFLAMDGVTPSNKDQGFILRRLLRRMIRAGRGLGVQKDLSTRLVSVVTSTFDWLYPQLPPKTEEIEKLFAAEEQKFFAVLTRGAGFMEKIIKDADKLDEKALAQKAFDLFQSVGYPAEIFLEEIKDKGIKVDEKKFNDFVKEVFSHHQEVSRAGIEKKFKGGLADTSEINTRYHTATHLLQKALREALGNHVVQLGSNITSERLRFDFPNAQKLSEDEIKKVEKIINNAVDAAMPVTFVMLPKEKAIEAGAIYMKNESYPDTVKVYYIGENLENAFSKEFCGGPHVENTSSIGHLEIFKQETLGDGKQRVYARFSNSL